MSMSMWIYIVHHCKEDIFSVRRKQSICMSGSRRLSQNELHVAGPVTAKMWWPYVSSWNLGTTCRLRLAEQRFVIQQLEQQVYIAQIDNPVPGHASTYTPSPEASRLLDLPHPANVAQSEAGCQATAVLVCATHSSRCIIHDRLQIVSNRLWCSSQQQIAIVGSGRHEGVNSTVAIHRRVTGELVEVVVASRRMSNWRRTHGSQGSNQPR